MTLRLPCRIIDDHYGSSSAPAGVNRIVAHDIGRRLDATVAFEENIGQFDAGVRFVSRGNGYTLLLTDREAVLALRKRTGAAIGAAASASVIRLSLERADAQPAAGVDRLPGVVNYLIGRIRFRPAMPAARKVSSSRSIPPRARRTFSATSVAVPSTRSKTSSWTRTASAGLSARRSSADFPTTRSGIQPSQRGRIDAFVVRIEP